MLIKSTAYDPLSRGAISNPMTLITFVSLFMIAHDGLWLLLTLLLPICFVNRFKSRRIIVVSRNYLSACPFACIVYRSGGVFCRARSFSHTAALDFFKSKAELCMMALFLCSIWWNRRKLECRRTERHRWMCKCAWKRQRSQVYCGVVLINNVISITTVPISECFCLFCARRLNKIVVISILARILFIC